MAKARIKTSRGITVEVEGTPAEISAVVQELGEKIKGEASARQVKGSGRVLLGDLIASLIDSRFFVKPKSLGDIKAALAEMGHLYPVTTLSPAMLRQVRAGNLRRLREKKFWVYTQGK